MQLYVGCSGWSYSAWLGHFYPQNLESKKYIEYYSKVFDYVEIDSSFYQTPTTIMTSRWARITPDNFRFTAKVPQEVTHNKRLGQGIDDDMAYFYKSFEPLKAKTLILLLQLPPSLTMKEGLKKIETFPFENGYRYAVEVRHKSWFEQSVYDQFSKLDLCLVWNQLDTIMAPPALTTDFVYIRFMETGVLMRRILAESKKIESWKWRNGRGRSESSRNGKFKIGIVAANNHYAGFGPATANEFRRMVGLPEMVWEEMNKRDWIEMKGSRGPAC